MGKIEYYLPFFFLKNDIALYLQIKENVLLLLDENSKFRTMYIAYPHRVNVKRRTSQ